jgi:DNA-directed RNA polymerase beta subunit/intein/homing endonuclease
MMDDAAFQKHTWKSVDRLFGFDREKISHNLIAHQLESYDDFVTNKIEEIINGFNPVKIYHKYQNSTSDFKHKIELKVLNVKLSKPSISEKDGVTKVLTPLEARQRNFSYSSNLTCDIEISYKSNSEGNNSTEPNSEGGTETLKTLRNVSFGKIPIMVGSKCCVLNNINDPEYVSSMTSECKYDPSGYFIINGNEKVIISHDRISENKTFVFLDSKATQYSIISEIRSCPNHTFGPPKLTSIKMTSKANQFGRLFRVNIHHIRTDIPIFILFKALGIESDKMIIQSVVHNIEKKDSKILMAELAGCVHEASTVNTQSQALEFLARYLNVSGYPKEIMSHKQKKIKILLNILKNDFLPHVGENFEDKAIYLGYMMKKLLLCHLGIKPFDDRDSYLNKRVDTPGVMLANLFRQYYGKLIKDCKNMIYKELNSGMWKSAQNIDSLINNHTIYKIIKPTTIESGLKYGLATGNWGIKNINSKQGVAQVLNRLTFYATLSHLRRVNTPIEKSGKLVQPRKLHSTQWGVICPAETPEGGSVGLVKNLAIAAKITISSNSEYLVDYLYSKDVIRFTYDIIEDLYDNVWVTLNGKIIGIHKSGDMLYQDLVQAKRNGIINPYTSIVWDISNNCIRLSTEGGRCVRPLYILGPNNKLLFDAEYVSKMKKEKVTWNDMISNISGKNMNIVEYLDVEECNSRLIATSVDDLKKDVQYTHMEIHPSLILGVLASNIPFSDHNQAPRNCYQCLWEEEPVLMADGTKKKIKEVQVGDSVLTFDPSTMKTKPTKVTNQYVRSTDKNIVEVETISGRKIITTDDHKYWTNQGWISPREFNYDTKVGVLIQDTYVNTDIDDYTIMTEFDFHETCKQKLIKSTLIEKHAKKLEEVNLLPLQSTSKHIPTIARIWGFLLADGSVNVYDKKHGGNTPQIMACFGKYSDADQFEKDIESLGFSRVKIREATRHHPGGAIHHTFDVTHNGSFASFIVSLGITTGKRSECNHCPLPDWIINGSMQTKKEFISGFQGGDGCKIRYNKLKHGFNVVCANTSNQIRPIYQDSLVCVFSQIVKMIREFGIEVTDVRVKNVKADRMEVSYKISDKKENLIKYFETIGYRYANHKLTESAIVVEYLKRNLKIANDQKKRKRNIIEMVSNGEDDISIKSKFGLSTLQLSDIKRSFKCGRQPGASKIDMSFQKFSERIYVQESTMFMPVKVRPKPNCMIADITVESETHCFFGGDSIAVHNSAMGKQAVGIYASNFRKRLDTLSHVLNYPQKPLCNTQMARKIFADEIPCGINVIVAIATWTGYNQEDSIMLNRSSVRRGLFASTYYRTIKEQCSKNLSTGEEELFVNPNNLIKNENPYKKGAYDHVQDDGTVPENTYLKPGDAILGKCMPIKTNESISYKDTSVVLKDNEYGYVDVNGKNHFTNISAEGYTFNKVRIRNYREPTIGDKLSSKHGQKGSIGMVYDEFDLPFTSEGLVPDIIINPHAIPSRMTIAQLIETIMGKACTVKGCYGNATPFTNLSIDTISKCLEEECGLESHGNEIMYNSRSGEQIKTKIFVGPTYYQRLKHMVTDKIHSRSSAGPIVLLTRQPSEGRARAGGLRLGEMEVECSWAHGTLQFLKERIMDCSDNYRLFICKKCNNIANVNPDKSIYQCHNCDNTTNFAEVRIPYASKLMLQEIQSMGISTKMITSV